jgi:biotin operon repressor
MAEADRVSNKFNTSLVLSRCMSQPDGQTADKNTAELRDEYPSGIRVLMQNESVGYMIDALMDMPGTHFSKSLLADKAGVSRQSVHTHIDLLKNLGIVSEIEGENHTEYTLNDDDELVRQLHLVEGLVHERLNPKVENGDE